MGGFFLPYTDEAWKGFFVFLQKYFCCFKKFSLIFGLSNKQNETTMTSSTTSNAQWQSAFTQAYLKLREENPTLPISGAIEMAKGEANAEMTRFEVACITLHKLG